MESEATQTYSITSRATCDQIVVPSLLAAAVERTVNDS